MKTVLHILTQPQEPLAQALMTSQRNQPELRVVVADLTIPEPDYDALLEQLFAADSVQVW